MAVVSNYALFAALSLSLVNLAINVSDPGASSAVFGLAVAAVILRYRPNAEKWKMVARLLLAAALIYVAFVAVVFGLQRGIDTGANLGIAIAAMALALAFDDSTSYFRTPTSFILVVPVALVVLVAFLSRLYRIDAASTFGRHTLLEWQEAATLALLSIYILARTPLRWPISALMSDYPQIRLLRYMLGFFSVLPVVLGASLLYAELAGLFDLRVASVYYVFASVVLYWAFILKGAGWAYRVSQMRDLAMRRLEESWRSREAYFRNLVDDSPVILYISGETGGCTFLSKMWEQYTGCPTSKCLGYGWLELVHPEDQKRLKQFASVVKQERREPFSREYRLRRADGAYRWVISSGFPRFDDKHRFIGYMGTVTDVHDRKIQEDTLIRDKRTAEQSNQTKSQFLANMSHEIRTPLNAILGFADLCGDDACSEIERVEYLKRIRYNGDHLLRLIDDILDLAKMESGSPLVQKSQLSIERTIDEIVASLRALASQKGLRLEITSSGQLPAVVYSDPHRIKQVVTNLVGNAIKFTSRGGVNVHLSHAGDQIKIEIGDTGIGLSAEARENLFKPFSQGDSSVTRRFGGTGLGLHLSRKLAQSIGGDVQLKYSEPGKGSVFLFSFAIGSEQETKKRTVPQPASPSSHDVQALPSKPARLYGRKILVAEDSIDSRELIQIYFRPTGAQLIYAENGLEAVNLARTENPDLILMDVQMPGVDGLEATRRLRSGGFKRPIVALTAHALQDEVDRSFEAGCSYHLTKPIMKEVLLSLVGDLLAHTPPAHMHH